MMRIPRELVVSLLLLTCPLACGGGSGDGGAGGGAVPPESFAPELFKAACAQSFKCCDAGELASMMLTSEAECVSMAALIAAFLGDLKAAVTDKRVAYDPAKAGSCIAAAKSASCGTSSDPMAAMKSLASCMGAVVGQVAVGGVCKSGWDCAGGSTCQLSGNLMDGMCAAEGKVGDACVFSFDCADELYCGSDDKCAARKATGATCADDDECVSESCVADKCAAATPTCDGK